MDHFLAVFNLLLQFLDLNLDERGELGVELVDGLPLEVVSLIPALDLRIRHYFLGLDRVVRFVALLCFALRRTRHRRLLVLRAQFHTVYAFGHPRHNVGPRPTLEVFDVAHSHLVHKLVFASVDRNRFLPLSL